MLVLRGGSVFRWAVGFTLGTIVLAASWLSAGSAAAASARLSFDKGTGSVFPTRNGETEVSVDCEGAVGAKCRGFVVLLPQGNGKEELGGDSIGKKSFKAPSDTDVDLRISLDRDASRAASDEPLRVKAVLKQKGSRKAADELAAVLYEAKPFKTSQAPRASASANTTEFSWNFDIPAGHYLPLKAFSCPADMKQITAGTEFGGPNRGLAHMAAIPFSASSGVGYAGFDRANISGALAGHAYFNIVNMFGWPAGGFWENSIWAPAGERGKFSFKVTCTDASGYNVGAADVPVIKIIFSDDINTVRTAQQFFPWRH
jgi:hypothetical protein